MTIVDPLAPAHGPVTTSIGGWRPTTALFRSVVTATMLAVVGVLWRRPDLLVLATPMAVISVWSILTRPTTRPGVQERTANPIVREGDATSWHATVDDIEGADHFNMAQKTMAVNKEEVAYTSPSTAENQKESENMYAKAPTRPAAIIPMILLFV